MDSKKASGNKVGNKRVVGKEVGSKKVSGFLIDLRKNILISIS